jgi:hypothetical protein
MSEIAKSCYTEQKNLAHCKARPDKRAMHGAVQLVPETALSIDVVTATRMMWDFKFRVAHHVTRNH